MRHLFLLPTTIVDYSIYKRNIFFEYKNRQVIKCKRLKPLIVYLKLYLFF